MHVSIIPRWFVVVGLVLVLSASALIGAPKARATDPLTVSVSCEGGAGTFFCMSSVSGGTGEYTRTWKAIQNAYFVGDTHLGSVHGSCTIGEPVTVKLVVIDSAGTKKNDEGTTACPEYWP